MPLPEFTGALGVKRAAHLLRRATAGATKQKIDEFATLTPAQAIVQLYRQALPPVAPPPVSSDPEPDLINEFKQWFIGQMMSPGIPSSSNLNLAFAARERLVFFLHSHFTTISEKVNDSIALYNQNQLFRFFALDALNPDAEINFKTLTVKICIDNAMLKVLDGTLNVKGSPNENYARELLELYSIGRGLPGTPTTEGDYFYFTEQDVRAAARVLSGWTADDEFLTIDIDTNIPRGIIKGSVTNASAHDNDPKEFSARFGNAIIQGDPALMNGTDPTEASAIDEIQQLIDLIYNQAETPRNICRKVYRFFVWGPHTEDEINAIEPIITEMVNTFVSNGYKLQPVIEDLLRSQHFYEAGAGYPDDNFGGIIKSPLDLVVGTLRFFDHPIPDVTAVDDFYATTGAMHEAIRTQSMAFYDPYDVAGYEAYHQFPLYHRFWITPNTLTRRYEFIGRLFDTMQDNILKVNLRDFVNANFNAVAADSSALIVAIGTYIYPVTDLLDFDDATNSGLTTARMNYFLSRFHQIYDAAAWANLWNTNHEELHELLAVLFNAMQQSPEYQLA